MVIAVTAPTGNVGSKVTSYLLNMKGIQVSLLTRDREKVDSFENLGAIVEVGDLEDVEFVSRSTATADALFWVTPAPPTSDDILAFQNRLGTNAATAVIENRIGRVVNLSCIGAHIGRQAGLTDGLHAVETHLNEAAEINGSTVTHLRPAFFMENYLRFMKYILERGAIPLPVGGERAVPMVATDDVAVEAVRHLAFPANDGGIAIPFPGPQDLTFDEAAKIIGEVLDRPVRHVQTEADGFRDALKAMGTSDDVVSRTVRMYECIEDYHVTPEYQRTDSSAAPTDFRAFCEGVLAPQIYQMEGV